MTLLKKSLTALMLIAVFGVGITGINQAFAQTLNNNAQTNIVAICAIALSNPLGFNFGDLGQGETSSEVQVIIDNTGSAVANISVQGNGLGWVDAVNTLQMVHDQSAYKDFSGTFASKQPVLPTNNFALASAPTTLETLFFQTQIDLINPLFTGAITHSIDVKAVCI